MLRSPTLLGLLALLFALGLLWPSFLHSSSRADDSLDYDLPDGSGHFYRQANGNGGEGEAGFAITNAGGIPLWDQYQQLGGPASLGYPVSRRFLWNGFVCQAVQKAVLQWRPETQSLAYINVLDQMHEQGRDAWLQAFRQTPPPFDTSSDDGLSWSEVVARHWTFLDVSPEIRERYWADAAPLDRFGLPVSYADAGNSIVVRMQRAVFQYWKEDVPWAAAGEVTIANAGDLAKEAGLLPAEAVQPEMASGAAAAQPTVTSMPSARNHDWRAPGYVAAVGGQLYDPRCVPLRSVGINVPNLAYRDGLSETLDWMRQRHMRWLRVFATGHALSTGVAPRDATAAAAALQSLLAGVEAFNAAHDPAESVYVLVSLTDYYPPGVPGDRYAFDHPTFRSTPALPAPWFRAGVRQFDFEQEHGLGRVAGLPNYEVNYKPWVRQVVGSLSGSPALLGWQLGNEVKARGSPRNGITDLEAYGWYLAFTRDIVDTTRSLDRNHLVFAGAQYIAELVDYEYRPKDSLELSRVPGYRGLVQQMLSACGEYCWNVWGLTAYDFNLYPIDDMAAFGAAGVASVATEYGFSLGSAEEMQKRFGGDRAAAVRQGFAAPWRDLAGKMQPRLWSGRDLMANGPLAGIAPWGSPAPGPSARMDTDYGRGITGAPDADALWAAWSELAARLEDGNRAAGASERCLGLH